MRLYSNRRLGEGFLSFTLKSEIKVQFCGFMPARYCIVTCLPCYFKLVVKYTLFHGADARNPPVPGILIKSPWNLGHFDL